jgi:phthiocerol/phenolphthiocerol synthesis type-I polyketide synthase E
MNDQEDLGAVAIIGMSGGFPGARDLDQFWENLQGGVESISRLTEEDLADEGVDSELAGHPDYVRAKGILDRAEWFDAHLFNVSAREAQLTDPQQRLFLEHAWAALENAGCDPSHFQGAIGVFAGSSTGSYLLSNLLLNPALRDAGPLELRIGNDRDFLATAVSYRLDLQGPGVNVATACSTSLVAVHLACQSLLNHECDAALAGGVSVSFPRRVGYLWQRGGIASADGHCRSFDQRASGAVTGEGVGVVVLKRLSDALADGDPIRAVVRGSAINNDGFVKAGFAAPGIQGQARVIAEALEVAGVEAGSITYVEAHGSGTPLGDSVELRALNRAFQGTEGSGPFCAVGSVKTNIGHLDAAAGIAGLIKTVLAHEYRLLPPSLHFEAPHPELEIEGSPFRVNTRLRPWERRGGPLRAGVSSFGIGGTNAHVILEAAPEPEPSAPSGPFSLLLLSAATTSALESAAARLAEHLARHPEQELADVAYTTQVGRLALGFRRAVVCGSRDEAAAALSGDSPRRLVEGRALADRPVAFLFSGTGDHYPGMGAGLYRDAAVFRREIDHCADLLRPLLGQDLREVLFSHEDAATAPGLDLRRMLGRTPAAAGGSLDRADLLHPAIFALEYALAKLWESLGVRPSALFGYSLGELTAACLAGVFSLEEALPLVVGRARLLETLPQGAMLAVPLGEDEASGLLGDSLSLAAVNAPDVCVVSGPVAEVQALQDRLRERGLACLRLPVSRALHSAQMDSILDPFLRLFDRIRLSAPRIPYVTGVTGSWATDAEACSPEHWARHLRQTVRFSQSVAALWESPSTALIEIGPGQGLTTLASRHENGTGLAVPSLRPSYDAQEDFAFFLGSLGSLWTAGVEVSWPKLHRNERRRKVHLPGYPFERRPYLVQRSHRVTAVDLEAAAPAPGEADSALHERPSLSNPYEAPRSESERTVAGIWSDVLDVESVGVHDSFFELGGNSLLASQVILRIEQAVGVELPLGALLERPTVAEVTELVEGLRQGRQDASHLDVGLAGEAILDPAIHRAAYAKAAAEPDAVLLTGATGFVGAFLLRDLLRETNASVYCLARAGSVDQARDRVRRSLVSRGIWDEEWEARILALPGDLGQPSWGLSEAVFRDLAERVGAIYHSGAWVNFTYPYAALEPANVEGTRTALRLASLGRPKAIHFISTLAVFAPGSLSPEGIGCEDSPLASPEGLASGYGQSKWVAEKLLAAARERGFEVAVYRPGPIGGDSRRGVGNPKDLIWAFLKGCLQLGAAPAIDSSFDVAPVDYVTGAVAALSSSPDNRGKSFHLFNPRPVPWREVFAFARSLGYPLRELPWAAWLQELRQAIRASSPASSPENALAPFWPLLVAESAGQGSQSLVEWRFDDRNTREALAGTPVACPPAGDLLAVYFTFLIESGFLPPPLHGTSMIQRAQSQGESAR